MALVLGGIVLAAGVAAAVWTLLAKRDGAGDPFAVADRRIDELEEQLHRLREVIAHSS
ncbi:MAG TPA: hypothetical protein PLZ36_10040 [Armatimonadota bacterium]|nr:hypothetical protein [Armatimonadota bacterium]